MATLRPTSIFLGHIGTKAAFPECHEDRHNKRQSVRHAACKKKSLQTEQGGKNQKQRQKEENLSRQCQEKPGLRFSDCGEEGRSERLDVVQESAEHVDSDVLHREFRVQGGGAFSEQRDYLRGEQEEHKECAN